jgi:hypothetical protein
MKICPLLQKECVGENCEWWAAGVNRCSMIALGILAEDIHDMGVATFKQYVALPSEPVSEPVNEVHDLATG